MYSSERAEVPLIVEIRYTMQVLISKKKSKRGPLNKFESDAFSVNRSKPLGQIDSHPMATPGGGTRGDTRSRQL